MSGAILALGLASCVTVTIDRPKKNRQATPTQPSAGIFEEGQATIESQPVTPTPPPVDPTKKLYQYTLVSGDTLWELSRDWKTTVPDIQGANGLVDSNVRAGQTILIPTNSPPAGAVEVPNPAPAPPVLTPAPPVLTPAPLINPN